MNSRLEQPIVIGLFSVVIFTALSHGAVEPWSVAIFRLMVTLLLLLWGISAVIAGELKVSIPATLRPVVAFWAVGLLQCISFTDATGRVRSLSLNVAETRVTVTTFFFILAAAIVAANFLTARDRWRMVARTLVIYGLALALFAIVQDFAWSGSFYWMRQLSWEAPSAFGPFVNHNHFAGYAELLAPLPVALIVTRAVRGPERLFCGFAAALMGVAIILSLSRGGMISLLAQLLMIGLYSLRPANERRQGRELNWRFGGIGRITSGGTAVLSRAGAVATISIAILIGIFWIDAEPVIHRVTRGQVLGGEATPQTETFFSSRGWIWQDTLALIRDNPVFGVGLGAYPTAYPIYSRSDELNVSQAHNDYLQVLADSGLIGGVLAVWFLIAVWRAVRQGLRQRDPLGSGLAIGGGIGMAGLLIHSLVDFNLQLPSTSLLFLILTVLVSQVAACPPDSTDRGREYPTGHES
ncbi:MAG: O-antigen ligase family protein [Blastocatellia bacterium]